MTQLNIIKQHLSSLVTYLQPLLAFANCHMVDYFSINAFTLFIPEEIKNELEKIGIKNAIDMLLNEDFSQCPSLKKYVENSRKYILKNNKNLCMDVDTFCDHLSTMGGSDLNPLSLKIFMTSKKSHEVEVLGAITAAIHKVAKTSHIIDIGDGKGYLSSMLALYHNISVLGVDASQINTNSAVNRVEKLSKVWNSITTGEKSKTTSKHLYRQITQYVDEKTNFKDLVDNIFLEKSSNLGVVGLHTCGNLASASLKIFHTNSHIKTICNVGCCYNFITEQFEFNTYKYNRNITTESGFPMSQFLIEKQFKLGRSARMVAAQSVDRIFCKKELPKKSIFYRALLEVLIKKYYPNVVLKDIGRFRKPCEDFVDYSKKALKRLDLNLELPDHLIKEFYCENEHKLHEINIFYLIRCLLAPVIESLILLDRLLFLHENGYNNSYLIKLFDPVISPRCYGLVSFK